MYPSIRPAPPVSVVFAGPLPVTCCPPRSTVATRGLVGTTLVNPPFSVTVTRSPPKIDCPARLTHHCVFEPVVVAVPLIPPSESARVTETDGNGRLDKM